MSKSDVLQKRLIPTESEARLIASIILDPEMLFLIEESGFDESFVFTQKYQDAYRILRDMVYEGKIPTPMTLNERLEAQGLAPLDVHALLHLMAEIPTAMIAIQEAERIKEAWKLRRAYDIANQLAQSVTTSPEESIPDKIMSAAIELMALPEERSVAVMSGIGAVSRAMQEILEAANRQDDEHNPSWLYWPEHWRSWQTFIRPLRPGLVGAIAAFTGVGKSTYLDIIAEHAARRGQKVLMYLMEDTPEYRALRAIARNARVPLQKIEDGNLTDAEMRKVKTAEDVLKGILNHITYIFAPGTSVAHLESMATRYRMAGNADVVMVDYVDMFRPSPDQGRRNLSEYGRQEEDMVRIKALAGKLSIPILVANQGRKDAESRMTIGHVRGSGARTYTTQLVVILNRPVVESDMWIGDTEIKSGQRTPVVTVDVVKQSRGPTVSFEQWLDGPHYAVYDMESRAIQ